MGNEDVKWEVREKCESGARGWGPGGWVDGWEVGSIEDDVPPINNKIGIII